MTENIEKMDFERLVSDKLTPGEMLKQAREAKNMSQTEVAKQLKLRAQWITDIENDNYQDAAALIYVKGYLSSYARLVNIPADEVLTAFNEMNFDEPFKARKQVSLSEEQFSSQKQALPYAKSNKSMTKKLVRVISLLVIVVLLALVVLWWKGQKVVTAANVQPQLTLPKQAQDKATDLPVSHVKTADNVAKAKTEKHTRWKRLSGK